MKLDRLLLLDLVRERAGVVVGEERANHDGQIGSLDSLLHVRIRDGADVDATESLTGVLAASCENQFRSDEELEGTYGRAPLPIGVLKYLTLVA